MKELICDKFYRNGFELHHVDKLVTNRPIAVFDLKNTAKAYPPGSWRSGAAKIISPTAKSG